MAGHAVSLLEASQKTLKSPLIGQFSGPLAARLTQNCGPLKVEVKLAMGGDVYLLAHIKHRAGRTVGLAASAGMFTKRHQQPVDLKPVVTRHN